MSLTLENNILCIDHNSSKTLNTVGGITIGGLKRVIVALTAASTLTTQQSGSLITLGTAGGFEVTLPSVATSSGVWYDFVIKVAPTTAYTVVCSASENKFHGLIVTNDVNSGTDADFTNGTAADRISFVANKALIGDRVQLLCDGSFWYSIVYTSVFDGVTIDIVS